MKKLSHVILKLLIEKSRRVSGATTEDLRQSFKKFTSYFPDALPQDFTRKLVDEFDARMRADGLSPNTVWKHHKNMKMLASEMLDADVLKKDPYNGFSFKQLFKARPDVTEEEIEKLYNANLSDELSFFRDYFLISYYTLLRTGDVKRIKDYRMLKRDGKQFLRMETQKTGSLVVIPVGPRLELLLNRIKWRRINNSVLNHGIKRAFAAAGIVRHIEIMSYVIDNSGVSKIFTPSRICDMVTIHDARRSGITALVKSGIPLAKVMVFSGHTTETALMRYIGIDQMSNAEELYEHKFFAT